MGDEGALEARLERAHTVIGDLLRSLGEVELLPERQRAAAREAIACLEDNPVPGVADFGMRLACARREAEETARIKAKANAVFEAQRTDLAAAIGVGGSAGATLDWNALVRRCSDLRREHVEMTAAVERIGAAHDRGVAMWREITQSEMTLPPVRAELMSWLLIKLDDDRREHASYVANLQHAHAHESAELRAEVERLTADLVQSEERRKRAEAAALAAKQHNKDTHELVATALDYPGWERAGWKDLLAAVEREHNELAELREFRQLCNRQMTELMEALPPGDEQAPLTERVAQLVREHQEMLAEMMKTADPEDIADAAASLAEPRAVPGPELGEVEFIDVVFDGPPGASHGRFVEVEDHRGHSMRVGEWLDRGDGMWALRIPMQPPAEVGEVMAAAGALSALAAVVATSGIDWRRSPCLAWVYGVLVGHDRDVLEDLQMLFNWPDGTVDEIDRHRRALLAARGA